MTRTNRPEARSRHLTGHVRHTRSLSRSLTHIRRFHRVYVLLQHPSQNPAEVDATKGAASGQQRRRHSDRNRLNRAFRNPEQHVLIQPLISRGKVLFHVDALSRPVRSSLYRRPPGVSGELHQNHAEQP